MEKLQAAITLGGILLSCYLTHFLAKKREVKTTNEFKTNLDYATQVDSYRDASQIERDRFAQLVFNQKNITFSELEYFIQYENADVWVKSYLLYKKNIQLERGSDGVVNRIYSSYSLKKYLLSIFGALFLAFCAMIPLLFWKSYSAYFQKNLLSQDYLVLFNIVIYPILFLISTFILFGIAESERYSKNFVKHFYASAIKTE